ncbi:hypothetical protein C922_05822, partial [Plasmodium inui San Antonio 1]
MKRKIASTVKRGHPQEETDPRQNGRGNQGTLQDVDWHLLGLNGAINHQGELSTKTT